MIVLEGPDGGGKTTLQKKLIHIWHGMPPDNYDVQVIHSPGPLDKGLYYWAMKALRQAKPVCIFDRFPYFSEAVYGSLLRDHPCMTTLEFIALRERLIRMRPLVIYCRPPLTTLQATRTVEDQMPGVLDHYEDIVNCYDDNVAQWIRDFRVFTYNFTGGQEANDMLMKAIKSYVLEEQRGEIL